MKRVFVFVVMLLVAMPALSQTGGSFFFPPTQQPLGISQANLSEPAQDGLVVFVNDAFVSAQMFFRRVKGRWLPWLPKSVQDFGAVCDGLTDDSEEFQAAADAGGEVRVHGPGTCMVADVLITNQVHFILDPDVIVKLNQVAQLTDFFIFTFDVGSAESVVEGGTLDGDRDKWWPAWVPGSNVNWGGIKNLNGNPRLTVRKTRFTNFIRFAVALRSGDGHTIEDVSIDNSGNGLLLQQSTGTVVRNVRESDIGIENGISTYQHGNEIRDQTACLVDGLSIQNYHPPDTGLDPVPNAIQFERLIGCQLKNLSAYDYTGTDPNGSRGVDASGLLNTSISGVYVKGYAFGIVLGGSENVELSDFSLDGTYSFDPTVDDWVGLRVSGGAIYPSAFEGVVSKNSRAVNGGRKVKVSNGTIQRFEIGVRVAVSDVSLSNVDSSGNTRLGFLVSPVTTSPSTFPGADPPRVVNTLLSGVTANKNGHGGLDITGAWRTVVSGGNFGDNGQDTSATVNERSGIRLGSGALYSAISGVWAGDLQIFASAFSTNGASFVPGSSTTQRCAFSAATCHIYPVVLRKPIYTLGIGQWITLADAGGPAVDLTGRVVDLDRDEMVFETAASATYSETGNLTALTGTCSTGVVDDTTLTCPGGALNTEVIGRTIIKADGEYRKVIRVNSATEAVIDSAFTALLSSDTVEQIRVGLEGLLTQALGARTESGVGTDNVIRGVNFVGAGSPPYTSGATTVVRMNDVQPSAIASLTAAASVSLLDYTDDYVISGATPVDTLTGGYTGRKVVIAGPAAGSSTLNDGTGNMALAGNFVMDTGDQISLLWSGTTWKEIARSAN